MKRIFNLALTPISKGDQVIQLAENLASVAGEYRLGKNSLPHVTLYHFEKEEKEIDNLWEKINKTWNEPSIELEFQEFSCITFDNNIYWTSLLPNHLDDLHQMHLLAAKLLGLPVKNSFDPHMTLINSKNKEYKKEVDKLLHSYAPITDTFVLTLGLSDEIGQLIEVISRYAIKNKFTIKI